MNQGREAFKLCIDDDLMQAGIIVRDPDRTTKQEIIDALKERKIVVADSDDDRIGRVIRMLRREPVTSRAIIVVKGEKPIDGKDGRIVDLVAQQARERDERGNVNHYESNVLRVVNSGNKLLEIIPPTPHRDGRDILGNSVPAHIGAHRKVSLGLNVELDEDKRFVIATAGGRFVYESGKAHVNPELKINKSVSFRTGNIDFESDVVINKDVYAGFEVRTKQQVYIRGTIEGARIEADGDVFVSQGILAKGKGLVLSRSNVACRFAKGAVIRSKKNIMIARYCYDSDIQCDGQLIMPEGALVGGVNHARDGMIVGTLGNSAGSRTVAHVDWIRPELPSCDDGSSAAPRRSQRSVDVSATPRIEVRKHLHAGSILRFGEATVSVPRDIAGNLRIEPSCTTDGSIEFIILDIECGRRQSLTVEPDIRDAA